MALVSSKAPSRGGDPTLSSSSDATTIDEEFMQVLDEMNRICGNSSSKDSNKMTVDDANEADKAHHDAMVMSPLEPLFGSDDPPPPPNPTSPGEDRHCSNPPSPSLLRSRQGSANSNQSCTSFDSAIGDVYSELTPPQNKTVTFDFDQDLFEMTPAQQPKPLKTKSPQRSTSNPLIDALNKVLSPQEQQQHELHSKRQSSSHLFHRRQLASPYPNMKSVPQSPSPPQVHRQDVEFVCHDLLRRFEYASRLHPRSDSKIWMSKSSVEDPLLITTKLIADALTRLRIFLFNLEPMQWLPWPDRCVLYNSHVCCISILKACASVDQANLQDAYPLPYGEYLGEVEALHLILAHDLYNELKDLIIHIQNVIGGRDLSVMLLVMMVAFFTPTPKLSHVQRVAQIHDYYAHKLQVYLSLRHGPSRSSMTMANIFEAVGKVRHFSGRLREFMRDVTRCGLQKQYESVCENIGLMAFLLQSEPVPASADH